MAPASSKRAAKASGIIEKLVAEHVVPELLARAKSADGKMPCANGQEAPKEIGYSQNEHGQNGHSLGVLEEIRLRCERMMTFKAPARAAPPASFWWQTHGSDDHPQRDEHAR